MKTTVQRFLFLFAALGALLPLPGMAQEAAQLQEIIVTAQRTDADFYSDQQPVIGLRRTADSAVQPVEISSDSRDERVRKQEILTMLDSALRRAKAAGVELVDGDFELHAITAGSVDELLFVPGNRPDTSRITFYVKAKLTASTGDAQTRIDDFIRGVPPSGRSLLEKSGSLTLTIVEPDQYRDKIVELIAAAAKKYAGYFGEGYGVEVSGLDQQLAWTQVSGSEVFLYIPYSFTVRPK